MTDDFNPLDSTIERVNSAVDITPPTSTPHKMHPNSLANLRPRPWKPGESGNPKGDSVSLTARRALETICEYDSKGRIWRDALADNLLRQALSKSTEAMRELLDRTEGKVKGDNLAVNVDNRVLNIYVKDPETKAMIEQGALRTRKQLQEATDATE